jgi:chemotaxis protein MotB
MLRRAAEQNDSETENVFWITMTDLLLGLAIIFMVLFVLAMTGFSQQKVQQQQAQSAVASNIIKQIKKQNLDVQINENTGEVKFSDLQLFAINSWQLTPKGKAYLDKFIPIYINAIYSNPKLASNISNILIQGHTDSHTFAGVSSKSDQYTRNMDLSLKRANAVAEYIFKTSYNKKYTDEMIHSITVEGRSFSDPVLVNGKEDFNKSRRVEMKLIVKNSNIQDYLMNVVK